MPDAMSPDLRLTIGVFARRSLLSMKALRLYDRLGLLSPAEVDPENGYRRYRESQLETARLISMLRRVEMPLAEIGTIINTSSEERGSALLRYWEAVEHRHAANRETVAFLESKLAGNGPPLRRFDIHERDVAEQVFLTEQRHVAVDRLTTWLGETIGRLVSIAHEHGGLAGPVTVIYYGEVSEEGDGPVEVCVPVSARMADQTAYATRIEPAHREGYTILRKAQVAFPQILSAYDAVWQWATETGREVNGAPREIYFADFMEAGPHDEVCMIALPVLALSPEQIERKKTMFDVKEREIEEQTMLTEQRNVTQSELVPWMGAAFGRLWENAGKIDGGMQGPVLAIYHGEVTPDQAGVVEVAGPVDATAAKAAGFETRVEPAHREAYVRLPKRLVQFPEILDAYTAVEAWTRENGKTITGSPREVYFNDFMAAGPDDDVTDVAFPIA